METKQHATEKPIKSMMKSQKKLKNTFRQMTMKTTIQNLWMQQKQFLERRPSLRNKKNLNLPRHLKELEQTKPKVSRKEIIKIREEISRFLKIGKKKKINETKSRFFERVNKIDKPLARLTKKREDSN